MLTEPVHRKILAVLEVFAVVFLVVPLLTLGIYRFFPALESWQTESLGFPFPVFVYVVMAGVSLAAVKLHRRSLSEAGLSFQPLRQNLDIASACFVPVALANLPFALELDYTRWDGALILALVQCILLFVLARLLQKKPSAPAIALASGLVLFSPAAPAWQALVKFLTFAVFVGFGEEILYRGYVQSRLNQAFGKPYRFYGVPFGWGWLLTALLFGLTHVGVLRWMLGLSGEITLAWGFWTVFAGLVFGFVREKSGSILPSALLHGLPQALAETVLVFL